MAQPAISRTVRNLEEALGLELIERGSGPLKLTAAGAAVAEGGAELLRRAAGLAHTAERASKGLIGELRIVYTDFAIAGSLPAIVNAFRAGHPDVGIGFSPLVTTDQVAALVDRRADVGLLTGPIRHPALSTHAVQEDEIVVALPECHRLTGGRRPRFEDLAQEAFVFGQSERWAQFLGHVRRLCHDAGFVPRVVQEAADSEAILSLVAAGLGVTLSIHSIASRPRPGVRVRHLEGRRRTVPTLLAWRRDNDNPIVKRFCEVAIAAGHGTL